MDSTVYRNAARTPVNRLVDARSGREVSIYLQLFVHFYCSLFSMVEPTCVCVPGTIEDGEKCHFDIYSSLQAEKDLPQYMLQHLSCFDEELFRSLVTQQPKRFFILFAPPKVSVVRRDVK